MSLLHFTRFFRPASRNGPIGGEEENGGDARTSRVASHPQRALSLDEDDSFGLPSDASLSDHEVIVGFPPGTLVEIFHGRHCQQEEDGSFEGRTILSSVPSDELMFPLDPPTAREYQHQFALEPVFTIQNGVHVENIPVNLDSRLPFYVQNALSISTAESEYRNLQSVRLAATAGDDSLLASVSSCDLSFSTLDVSSLPSTYASPLKGQSTESLLDGPTFRNIADRLALQQRNGDWFSHFTEQDWNDFQITANMVLQVLVPTHHCSSPLLSLPPPTPTTFAILPEIPAANTSVEYDWRDHLPESFLCCLCHNAIVGATALSCACNRSSVCAECWESYSTRVVENEDSEYLYVSTQHTCPSCQGNVHSAIPCHALDMAITYSVMNIPEPLQRMYYSRLDRWRIEVLRRMREDSSSTPAHQQSLRHDIILAELIQQEEEYFWKKNATMNQTFVRSQHALLFVGEMAVCMAVASLSAVGLTVLVSRRS